MKRFGVYAGLLLLVLVGGALAWDLVLYLGVEELEPYDSGIYYGAGCDNMFCVRLHGDIGARVLVRVTRTSDEQRLFEQEAEVEENPVYLDSFTTDEQCDMLFELELVEQGQGTAPVHGDLMKQPQ